MPESNTGFFSDNPQTEWLTASPGSQDREMKLLRDFYYIDPQGRQWLAPKDSIVDGASIPMALWSSIGSPYTDDYRRASIVHDVACRAPNITRKEADVMFYYACMAGGCSSQRAALLYAGVRIGSLIPEPENVTDRTDRRAEFYEDNSNSNQIQALTKIADEIKASDDSLSLESIDDLLLKAID